jgi:hypothetical protein
MNTAQTGSRWIFSDLTTCCGKRCCILHCFAVPRDIFHFAKYWSTGGMKLTGENRSTRGKEKPVQVPLCPPQIWHGLTQDRTRAFAAGGRRLIARAIARPCEIFWNGTITITKDVLHVGLKYWRCVEMLRIWDQFVMQRVWFNSVCQQGKD